MYLNCPKMIVQNPNLELRKAVEKDHSMAANTFISSPCGKFKVKCRVNSLSHAGYALAVLYHRQGLGDKYEIGQYATFYHEGENWSRLVSISERNGNMLVADVVDPVTTITVVHVNGVKTTYVCDFLGCYCDLYRVSFSDYDQLIDGTLFLQLPNGENFQVKLRWRHEEEVCFQVAHRSPAVVGKKTPTGIRGSGLSAMGKVDRLHRIHSSF